MEPCVLCGRFNVLDAIIFLVIIDIMYHCVLQSRLDTINK